MVQQDDSRPVVIIGAGGLGQEVLDALTLKSGSDRLRFGGFLDDHITGENVLGPVKADSLPAQAHLILAVGDSETRFGLAHRLRAWPDWISIVHPSSVVSPRAKIGRGTFIGALSYVGPRAVIGRHTIVNVHCEVAHDVVMADFVTLSPLAALNGHAIVNEGCFLGTSASVDVHGQLQEWSRVSAGTRVTRSFPACSLISGNPAKGRVMYRVPQPGPES